MSMKVRETGWKTEGMGPLGSAMVCGEPRLDLPCLREEA